MTSRSDRRPRHEQLAAEIRARIVAGELAPGTQLPSTAELVTQYAAANATVQRALSALKDEGLLYSQVGRGVYVRDHKPLVVDSAAYLAPNKSAYSYELLRVSEVEAPVRVAQALGLGDGDDVLLRQRLLRHDGEPVEVSWSYYPLSLARGTELAQRRKIPGGAPRVLAAIGHPQRELLDSLAVRMPTTEEVEILELPANVPVIRQFRVIRSTGDRPVEASILVKGGHRHELRYRQQIPIED